MRKENNSNTLASLLQRAEEQLKNKKGQQAWAFTNEGVQKLVHELHVHQVELEMQNEELRAAEELARISAEKYTSLYDYSSIGYFTLDSEGTISGLNFKGASLLGKDRSSLIHQNFKSNLTPATRPVFDNFLKDIFVENTRQACEARLTTEGNPSSYVHLEGMISEDKRNCYLTAVDISAIKDGSGELRESETHYRRFFESAKDGILILDAVSGEILDMNPTFNQLLGYSPEELIGKELWEVDAFKKIGYSQYSFIELQIRGDIRYDDMPLVTKFGRKISVEFVSHVYVANHKKVIQCNIRNITERKRLEKALQESEARFRELNSTKDKFFSIIGHDLRGPFNSILGFSELLIERIEEKDYEEVRNYATIINQSSQRAMELVTNLLEWSRSKLGRMQFHPEQIDIATLTKSVIQLLKDLARQKSITLYAEVPEKATVYADKAMMAAILRNLVSNAIKFTPTDGEIVVSAQSEDDQLILMVADNGVGIKKEALKKLFTIEDSFTTLGTQDEKGTGLGLILCKEFIEKHNGDIRVESEPGKGSKFYVTIPQKIEKVNSTSRHQFEQ